MMGATDMDKTFIIVKYGGALFTGIFFFFCFFCFFFFFVFFFFGGGGGCCCCCCFLLLQPTFDIPKSEIHLTQMTSQSKLMVPENLLLDVSYLR